MLRYQHEIWQCESNLKLYDPWIRNLYCIKLCQHYLRTIHHYRLSQKPWTNAWNLSHPSMIPFLRLNHYNIIHDRISMESSVYQWICYFEYRLLLCISSHIPDFFFPGFRTIWIYSCMDGVIIHDTENFHYIDWSLNPVYIGYNAFERIDNRIESNISYIFNIFPSFQSIECIYIYPYFFHLLFSTIHHPILSI